jgi:hypothetical protein
MRAFISSLLRRESLDQGDIASRSLDHDLRVVAGLRMGSDSGVETFQGCVLEALLRHLLGQALQDLRILGEKPCTVASHLGLPRSYTPNAPARADSRANMAYPAAGQLGEAESASRQRTVKPPRTPQGPVDRGNYRYPRPTNLAEYRQRGSGQSGGCLAQPFP